MALEILPLGPVGGQVSPDSPKHIERYLVRDTEDVAEVDALIYATLPAYVVHPIFGAMSFQDYDRHALGGRIWHVDVTYGRDARHAPQDFAAATSRTPFETGSPNSPTGGDKSSSWSFDTSGGTQHITQSLNTVYSDGIKNGIHNPAFAPQLGGVIGLNGDSVEGCDIITPKCTWQETYWFHASTLPSDYLDTLVDMTGCINDATFRNRPTKEVLFLGAQASRKGLDDVQVTYNFTATTSQNLKIGDFASVPKAGQDYLWVMYERAADSTSKLMIKTPKAVFVEQVYPLGDFSRLGIKV